MDAELNRLDDEVHATIDSNGVVEGKAVDGEALPVDDHDVTGREAVDSNGDAGGAEFVWIVGVLVQHEKVGVREVVPSLGRNEALKNQVEELADVVVDGGDAERNEVREDVHRVSVEARASVFRCF